MEENSQLRNVLIRHTCSMASGIQSSEDPTQTNARNVNNSALESMKCSVKFRDNIFCVLFTLFFFLATVKRTFFSLLYYDIWVVYGEIITIEIPMYLLLRLRDSTLPGPQKPWMPITERSPLLVPKTTTLQKFLSMIPLVIFISLPCKPTSTNNILFSFTCL